MCAGALSLKLVAREPRNRHASGTDVIHEFCGAAKMRARIAICGQISQSNDPQPSTGPRMWRQILVARAKVHGFLVFDYAARYGAALGDLAEWVRTGQIKYREDIIQGGRREIPNRRELFEEPLIIRRAVLDSGPLKEIFGDQDSIGVPGPTPRQVPSMRVVPREQPRADVLRGRFSHPSRDASSHISGFGPPSDGTVILLINLE